jgi:hypothetical protein
VSNNKVKVGPFDLKIVNIDRTDDWGYYDPIKLEIGVQNNADRNVRAETLVHEILHVIWDVYGVKKGDGEERTVTALAIGISASIRDNPKFWQSIMADFNVLP